MDNQKQGQQPIKDYLHLDERWGKKISEIFTDSKAKVIGTQPYSYLS